MAQFHIGQRIVMRHDDTIEQGDVYYVIRDIKYGELMAKREVELPGWSGYCRIPAYQFCYVRAA